jgi:CBS domain-containing protein
MTARDLMTPEPASCTRDTALSDVARLMVQRDCGQIPVVDDKDRKRVIGVVTDRDIVCRAVAKNSNPLDLHVETVMSSPAVTVVDTSEADEVQRVMEKHQIRRVPVVNQNGELCGIVSQADIARRRSSREAGELVRDVSVPAK